MNEIDQTENDKWQLNDKPAIAEVDRLAKELCREYDNYGYFKWYCLVINALGASRVAEIRARCSDAQDKGRLFSKIAGEEAKTKLGYERYSKLRGRHGGR